MHKEPISIDFEGVNWNASHWATKTEEEFTKEAIANNVYSDFKPADQKNLLSAAYKQIKAKVKAAPVEDKVDPVKNAVDNMKVHGPAAEQEEPGAVQPGTGG